MYFVEILLITYIYTKTIVSPIQPKLIHIQLP